MKNNLVITSFKKSFFYYSLLITSFIYSTQILNLYYLSTFSPDFDRYIKYFQYFESSIDSINLEQGLAYYFVIYLVKKYFYNFVTFDSLEEFYAFDDHEFFISLAIQTGNSIFYLIGLLGLYYLLVKYFPNQQNLILSALSLLNFTPQSFYIRATMKPEIIAFSMIPWVLLFLEKYKESKNIYFLLSCIPPVLILSTSKGSIAAMLFIVLLLNYSKEIKNIDKRILLVLLAIFLSLFFILNFENYAALDRYIFERTDLLSEYNQENYDNKASVSFLYNINLNTLKSYPFRDNLSSSFISITLSDTFDDYFNLYNNLDYSLLKSSRKYFVESGSIFSYNSTQNIMTVPFGINLDYLRRYIAVLFTAFFYFFVIRSIKHQKNIRKFTTLPLIGMFVLLLNSFGIPENNFDPAVGDTVKPFYYSFFFLISFSFILIKYLSSYKNRYLKMTTISVLYIIFLFILGFPKANNTFLDYSIKENNSRSYFCTVNKPILYQSLIETQNMDCKEKVERFCISYLSIYNGSNANNSSVDLINTENIDLNTRLYKNGEVKTVNNYSQCKSAYDSGFRLKNNIFLNKIPFLNLSLLLIFIFNIFYFLKKERYFSKK